MKVDIAINSFQKPELLLKTLLTLKKVTNVEVANVWINDDSATLDVVNYYQTDFFRESLSPWNIIIRSNTQRGGWWYTPVKGLNPNYLTLPQKIAYSIRGKIKGTGFSIERENVRYQWAIDNTKQKYLFIIHDDVNFEKDILSLLYKEMEGMTKAGIAGDLGQCWRCEYEKKGCHPNKINNGYRPSTYWPNRPKGSKETKWPCRINEWCCLLSVEAAKDIESKHQVLFGWYDNKGDISAYWFYLTLKEDYEFYSIPKDEKLASDYYVHADGGSGHSVWVDQGNGKKKYDAESILIDIKKLLD